MTIAAGMTPTFGRDAATTIVLGVFWSGVAAVGQSESDKTQNFFFAIGAFGGDATRKKPDEYRITHGTMEQVSSDLREAHAVMMVNVTDIVARLRARAVEVGVDLS